MNQAVENALVVRMEATLRKFERQMEAGRRAAEKNAVAAEKAWDRGGKRIAANANQAATGLQRLTNVSGRGRFVLQNTANQIGDIAVQMGSGTSASRALGQQLPQLLGGFGALSGTLGIIAPLLGTVAALGIPLAAALWQSGEAAADFEDQLKDLEKAISALESSQKRLEQSPVSFVDQYGGLADEARQIFEIDRQIKSIQAQAALDTVARGVAGELGMEGVFGFGPEDVRNLEGTISSLKAELADLNSTPASSLTDSQLAEANRQIDELRGKLSRIEDVAGNVDELSNAFGITATEAQEVVAMFAAIGQAQGPREQVAAMIALADYIQGVSNNLSNAEEEGQALYDQLVQAAIQALRLAQTDMAAPIADAASEATRLADELARARDTKITEITGGNVDFFDPRNESGMAGRIIEERGVPKENQPGYTPPRTRRSGGGGSARIPDGLREAQRLFQDTRTEAEKYAAEVNRINDLHRQFPDIITEDVRDRALAALDDSVNKLSGSARTLETSFANLFTSIITGSTSAKDAVGQLLGQLAQLLAQSAFSGFFGGSGGILSALGIPGFATGTNFAPGGLALVGEQGPELVNLPRGSQVFNAGRTERMLSGGGGGVSISIDARGAQAGVAEQIEAKVRTMLPEITRASVAAVGQARQRGYSV